MSAVFFDQSVFADAVMSRVAAEPTPTVTGALRSAVARLSIADAVGAAATSWHLATTRAVTVSPRLRLQSAMLLAVLMLVLAMGTTLAAAGAAVVVERVAQRLQSTSFVPVP